jgi:hypothetical protein
MFLGSFRQKVDSRSPVLSWQVAPAALTLDFQFVPMPGDLNFARQ